MSVRRPLQIQRRTTQPKEQPVVEVTTAGITGQQQKDVGEGPEQNKKAKHVQIPRTQERSATATATAAVTEAAAEAKEEENPERAKNRRRKAPSIGKLREITDRLEADCAALLAATTVEQSLVAQLVASVAALREIVPVLPPRPPCRAPLPGEVLFSLDFECFLTRVPCEIGLTAFTREHGEIAALQTLINPGSFQMQPSINFAIRLHGIRTLDLPPAAPQPTRQLCALVTNFIAKHQNTPELQPLLFAKGSHCEEECIAWMYNNKKPSPLRVLDIAQGDGVTALSKQEASALYRSLADDPEWHRARCCSFHAKLPQSKHCALVDARAVQHALIEDYRRSITTTSQ